MANNPKHMRLTDEEVAEGRVRFEAAEESALSRVKAEKAAEEERRQLLHSVHSVGLKMGRVQAFEGMALMAEFLRCKAMQEVIDDKKILELMGFSSVDAYFEAAGLSARQGYNNLKIARSFTAFEVQFFGRIGLTKKDLLGLASIPENKRPRIVDGVLENYENADNSELYDICMGLISEAQNEDNSRA